MNNSQEVAKTIKDIAKRNHITIGKMLSDCQLSVNTLSSMQAGGYYPRLEAIAKIADYLDCSVDYLLGRSATPEINQPVKEQSEEITITYAAYGAGGKTVQKKVTPEIMEKINRLMSDD